MFRKHRLGGQMQGLRSMACHNRLITSVLSPDSALVSQQLSQTCKERPERNSAEPQRIPSAGLCSFNSKLKSEVATLGNGLKTSSRVRHITSSNSTSLWLQNQAL